MTVCPLDATASTEFLAGLTALDVPPGMSAIRFSARRACLLIALLNVRVDGNLVTLQNTLGDGTVGDLVRQSGYALVVHQQRGGYRGAGERRGGLPGVQRGQRKCRHRAHRRSSPASPTPHCRWCRARAS